MLTALLLFGEFILRKELLATSLVITLFKQTTFFLLAIISPGENSEPDQCRRGLEKPGKVVVGIDQQPDEPGEIDG